MVPLGQKLQMLVNDWFLRAYSPDNYSVILRPGVDLAPFSAVCLAELITNSPEWRVVLVSADQKGVYAVLYREVAA